jgi:hypothetical protein
MYSRDYNNNNNNNNNNIIVVIIKLSVDERDWYKRPRVSGTIATRASVNSGLVGGGGGRIMF